MNKRLVGLGLGLTFYYLAVVWFSGFFANPHYFLFDLAHDSIDYTSVANFLFHGTPSEFVARRSFGYPLFLGLARLGGDNLIWLLQGGLWVASAMLFYLCLPASRPLRIGFLTLYILVWTPILLTLVVLTESLARFAFALMVFLLVRRQPKWAAFLVTVGGLAVVKPNYAPLFLVVLAFLSLAQFFGRLGLSTKRFFVFALISVVPLALQLVLAAASQGPHQNTSISHYVLQQYFFPQVVARVSGRDLIVVREEAAREDQPTSAILSFFADHPGATLACAVKNLEENIRSVFFLDHDLHPIENFWRKSLLNSAIYWLHILMLIPLLICLWKSRGLHDQEDLVLWTLALVFLLGMLPTAITYWAGDRLSSPLLPVWPVLYLLVYGRFRKA